jgi:three-Cys-motif partner protein
MAVNRLLTRTGEIREKWKYRLTAMLGTEEWYDAFYREMKKETLFGPEMQVEKAPVHTVGEFFIQRLESIFPGVLKEPGILRNSKNRPLYMLCFAAANKRGAPIALRIAKDLVKDLR